MEYDKEDVLEELTDEQVVIFATSDLEYKNTLNSMTLYMGLELWN
tara:strand:+ start:126 stop:260 length:135 start_codon:yes stop_codon:yes gene_type:complete